MRGILKAFAYSDLDRGFAAFLDWAGSMGISTSSTRLHHYSRSLDELIAVSEAKDEEAARTKLKEFLNTLLEIHDLIQIHQGLAGRGYDRLILQRLKEIVSGPVRYTDENVSSSNRPRNLAFELLIASRLVSAGLPLRESGSSDIATKVEGKSILVECKRPQSDKRIEGSIKDAYRQLKRRYSLQFSHNVRGMAAIDITKAFNPAFGAYPYDNPHAVGQWLSRVIDAFSEDYRPVIAGSGQRKTVGLIVRLSVIAQPRENAERIIYAQQYGINTFASSRESDRRAAKALGRAIESETASRGVSGAAGS